MVESLVFTNNVKIKYVGCYDTTTWRYLGCTVCKMRIIIFTSPSVSDLW